MDSVHTTIAALDKRVVQATLTALLNGAEDVKGDYTSVQSDWQHKVEFKQQTTITPVYMDVLVTPTGANKAIWTYVDLGTGKWGKNHSPYLIVPKQPGGMLKFRTGYSPRTAPIARANVGTGIASGDWVSKASVIHPGIKSRLFSETFAKQLTPPLDVRVTDEIKRVV